MNKSSTSRTLQQPGSSHKRPGGPSALASEQHLSGPARRLLNALRDPDTLALPDPSREGAVMIQGRRAGVSVGRGQHLQAALETLRDRDLVEDAPERGRMRISDAGRACLRRLAATDPATRFGAQHRELVAADVASESGPERVTVNAHESPLEWLRRRRDRDGEPLIDAAAFEAGERLRRDLTFAGMLPSVTARWEAAVASGGAGPRDPAGATDAVIAGRQRVRAALASVGGDFADLLTDLCGFLKGLETIERERGWPPRSGKVVVRLALRQLARHYGLEPEARGPARSRGLQVWQAEDARPA